MIRVNIINDANYLDFSKDFKKIAFIASLKHKVFRKRQINVFITDNKTIHEYNLKFRNIDRETDVLSFPSEERGELGDIIISYERVKTQAIEYGHSERREICFLFTHGVLHCLGYDHMNEDEEKEMFYMQDYILNKANIRRDYE